MGVKFSSQSLTSNSSGTIAATVGMASSAMEPAGVSPQASTISAPK